MTISLIQAETATYFTYLRRDILTLTRFCVYLLSFFLASELVVPALQHYIQAISLTSSGYFNTWLLTLIKPQLYLMFILCMDLSYVYLVARKEIIDSIESKSITLDNDAYFALSFLANKLINAHLDSIELKNLNLTRKDIDHLMIILNNNHIKNLNIVDCEMSDNNLKFLLPHLKTNKVLVKFNITGADINKTIASEVNRHLALRMA